MVFVGKAHSSGSIGFGFGPKRCPKFRKYPHQPVRIRNLSPTASCRKKRADLKTSPRLLLHLSPILIVTLLGISLSLSLLLAVIMEEENQAVKSSIEDVGEDFYEMIEAPKFVDFTAPGPFLSLSDDRYWFCSRVGLFLLICPHRSVFLLLGFHVFSFFEV